LLLTADLNGNDSTLKDSFECMNDHKVTTFENKIWFVVVECSMDVQLVPHFFQILAMGLMVLIGLW